MATYSHPEVLVETDWVKQNLGKPGVKIVEIDVDTKAYDAGHVAGAVFSRLKVPGRVILMCPNHTGRGRPLSIMSEGSWETPLGSVPIDSELADSLKQRCSFLSEDMEAHRGEHAAEVELPFLLALRRRFTFVPIALGTHRLDILTELGKAMARVIARQNDPVLVIASSDMNHYASDAETRRLDEMALAAMETLDAEKLFETVTTRHISMCGMLPAVIVMETLKRLKKLKRMERVAYGTSGDVSGDTSRVVGYAGMLIG